MGVSYSEGNKVDLDAIIQGGEGFVERIKTIKAAKDAHDKAFEDLNIGRSAAAAYADAQATVANALKSADEIKAESEKTAIEARATAAGIVPAAQAEGAQIIADAKAEAARITDTAKASAALLDADVSSGRQAMTDWSAKIKADADGIMRQAIEARAAADKQLSDNKAEATRLAAERADAKSATDTANALQAQLSATLQDIEAAAARRR